MVSLLRIRAPRAPRAAVEVNPADLKANDPTHVFLGRLPFSLDSTISRLQNFHFHYFRCRAERDFQAPWSRLHCPLAEPALRLADICICR